jgi:DNA-binding transcriptional MocR family regulator
LELSTVGPESLSTLSVSDSNDRPEATDTPTLRVHIPRSSQGPNSVRKVNLDTALQYGSAQGYPPLHAWLLKLTNSVYHPNIPYRGGADIMINGGSADGLSKIYELLFNYWDKDLNDIRDREGLIVEEFVYAPPIAQVRQRDVNIVPIRIDSQGMLAYGTGSLFDVLQNWDSAQGRRPHALYIIP